LPKQKLKLKIIWLENNTITVHHPLRILKRNKALWIVANVTRSQHTSGELSRRTVRKDRATCSHE